MTLSRRARALIAAWTDKAQPLSGVYFRSVSYTFMKPETVLEGAGAAAHGGCFASPGTPAVYLSESDAVATNEVTGRKKRLGGATLINVDKYTRVVFAVRFDLMRVLDLSQRPLPTGRELSETNVSAMTFPLPNSSVMYWCRWACKACDFQARRVLESTWWCTEHAVLRTY